MVCKDGPQLGSTALGKVPTRGEHVGGMAWFSGGAVDRWKIGKAMISAGDRSAEALVELNYNQEREKLR